MSCEKILFRPEVLTDTSADLTFKIKKQDDGDATVDTVATATYTATLASNTSIVINRSDFDNPPTVGAKDKVAISVQAGADPSGVIDWYVTSVWKTEIQVSHCRIGLRKKRETRNAHKQRATTKYTRALLLACTNFLRPFLSSYCFYIYSHNISELCFSYIAFIF